MSSVETKTQVEPQQDRCPSCGTSLDAYHTLQSNPGFCLECNFPLLLVAGKYRLYKQIGAGAMGKVYLAHHVRLRNSSTRVVKVIKQEILDTPGTIERFYREVQVTSTLSEQNEHIIRVYDDFGEIPRLGYFYIMEYIDGLSLRDYVERNHKEEPLSVEMALDIFTQLCNAMQTAHHVGVVHRDLKPDNMMLAKRGDTFPFVKVLDWGIAKPTGSLKETDLHLTQGSIGTPLYMSPEQLLNEGVDHRSDQYAMGLILYEMLAGDNPFLSMTGKGSYNTQALIRLMEAQLYKMPPLLSEFSQRTDLPPELDPIIHKMLAKQPRERYECIDELVEELKPVLDRYNLHAGPRKTQHNPGMYSPTLDESDNVRGVQIPTGNIIEASDSVVNAPTMIAEPHQRAGRSQQNSTFPVWIGGFLLLFLLGGGSAWWFTKKNKNSSVVTPPPQRRTLLQNPARVVPKRVVEPPVRRNAVQPDAGKEVLPEKRVVPEVRKVPVKRKVVLRPKPRRKVRKRRVVRRRAVRRRVSSPCKSSQVLLEFSFGLSSKAEISLSRGKVKRLSSRRYCVNKTAGRVSILQEGYSLCIFSVPKSRSKARIRLLPEGRVRPTKYCLR